MGLGASPTGPGGNENTARRNFYAWIRNRALTVISPAQITGDTMFRNLTEFEAHRLVASWHICEWKRQIQGHGDHKAAVTVEIHKDGQSIIHPLHIFGDDYY